jgi:hypothetical protein
VPEVIPAALVFEAAMLRAGSDARSSIDIFSQHYLDNFNSGSVGVALMKVSSKALTFEI